MISAAALRDLMALGLEGENLLEIVTIFERDASRDGKRDGLSDYRSKEAIRAQNYRDRKRDAERDDSVTGDSVTRETPSPPSPPSSSSPLTLPLITTPSTSPTPSGAIAPRDIRGDLFGGGLKSLATMTGKTPDSCRSLVGRWLKSVNDEAIHVLGAIENAERNRVADPVAWINRALQSHTGNRHGKPTVHDAGHDLTAKLRALNDGPPDLCERAGASSVRLLPSR